MATAALIVWAGVAVVAAGTGARGGLVVRKDFVPEQCTRAAKKGDHVHVHFEAYIDESSAAGEAGRLYERSRAPEGAVAAGGHKATRDVPLAIMLGAGHALPALDRDGLLGMCVGEKRTLVIPPELGYGEHGKHKLVPPGATLRYVVELIKIDEEQHAPQHDNVFQEADADGDGKIVFDELKGWFQKTHSLGDEAKVREVFDMDDRDKNGHIDWDEFSGPKGLRDEL